MNPNYGQYFNSVDGAVFEHSNVFHHPPLIWFNRIFEALNNSRFIPAVISALTDSLCVKFANAYKATSDLNELTT